MSKKKYRKAIASFDKRISEHKEKQKAAKSQELFHYWQREVEKFKREKKKKQKWL